MGRTWWLWRVWTHHDCPRLIVLLLLQLFQPNLLFRQNIYNRNSQRSIIEEQWNHTEHRAARCGWRSRGSSCQHLAYVHSCTGYRQWYLFVSRSLLHLFHCLSFNCTLCKHSQRTVNTWSSHHAVLHMSEMAFASEQFPKISYNTVQEVLSAHHDESIIFYIILLFCLFSDTAKLTVCVT